MISEIMRLKPDELAFVEAYFKYGNATEAYRVARPYSRNWKGTAAVQIAAYKMMSKEHIKAKIREVQEELERKSMEKAVLTLESHLDELETLREMAKEAKNIGAAINAEVARGKVKGYYVNRIEVDDAPAPVAVHIQVVDGRKAD